MKEANASAINKTRSRYTYITDELGHILETRAPLGDPSFDSYLTTFRKPNKPMFIDTPEKQAMWDSYWDNIVGWWEGERANERRQNWL